MSIIYMFWCVLTRPAQYNGRKRNSAALNTRYRENSFLMRASVTWLPQFDISQEITKLVSKRYLYDELSNIVCRFTPVKHIIRVPRSRGVFKLQSPAGGRKSTGPARHGLKEIESWTILTWGFNWDSHLVTCVEKTFVANLLTVGIGLHPKIENVSS